MMLEGLGPLLVHGPSGLSLITEVGDIQLAGPEVRSFAIDPRSARAAFSVLEENGERLLVVDESGKTSDVYEGPVSIEGLTWGPGESSVTFVARTEDDATQLTLLNTESGTSQLVTLLDVPHYIADPSWSHDGRWLAVEVQPTEQLRGITVYLYDRLEGSLLLVDPIEEPIPMSVSPGFAPAAPILAYTYSSAGALVSEVRFLDANTGERRVVEARGLNDPRWSTDGLWLLAVSHRTICETDLVRIDVSSLEIETLVRGAGHLSPMFLHGDIALFVERACERADDFPTEAGDLYRLDMSSGQLDRIGQQVYAARPLVP